MKQLMILLLLTLTTFARENHERYYQEISAKQLVGEMEVIQEDSTRVDIVTKTHAIEVDFADKWAEGIGQCLHYSGMTGLDAGLILIVEGDKDDKYVELVKKLLIKKSLRIYLWVYDQRTKTLTLQ